MLTWILFLSLSLVYALVAPQVINTDTKKEVLLGTDAQAALKKWNPQFQMYQVDWFPPTILTFFQGRGPVTPMAALGDFNGDAAKDIALLGHDRVNEIVVVLLAQKTSFKAVVVQSRSYKDPREQTVAFDEASIEKGSNFYLALAPAAELKFKSKKVAKRDGLQLENYGGDTRVFYFSGLQMKEYKGLVE